MLGYYTLIRQQENLKSFNIAATLIDTLKNNMIHLADQLINGAAQSTYGTVMGKSARDFIWGSNAVAANQGIALLQAYYLSKDKKYLTSAIHNADYLLGRNGTGYSFITGFGHKPSLNPHHRPSIADSITAPVPGWLVGGANPGKQDHCTYPSSIPDEAYSDTACSYASNEVAINWNAPAVYLLNAIEALCNN
jgi:endoglucanase